MINKTSRAIAAFAVTPFVPTTLLWVCLLPMHFHRTAVAWNTVKVICWTTVVITLPLTLAIGIPVYVLIEKRSTLRRQHVLVSSGTVGFTVGLITTTPVVGALLGLSAGITFWLIWHRARDAKSPF